MKDVHARPRNLRAAATVLGALALVACADERDEITDDARTFDETTERAGEQAEGWIDRGEDALAEGGGEIREGAQRLGAGARELGEDALDAGEDLIDPDDVGEPRDDLARLDRETTPGQPATPGAEAAAGRAPTSGRRDAMHGVGGGAFDLVEVESEAPGEVRVGEPFAYRLRVTNTSDVPVHGTVLLDQLPEGLRVRAVSEPAQDLARTDATTGAEAGEPRASQASAERPATETEAPTTTEPQPTEPATDRTTEGDRAAERRRQGAARPPAADERGGELLGTLHPGETRLLEVSGLAREEGPVHACVPLDFHPVACAEIQAVAPELALVRELSQDAFYSCDELRVVYRVTNAGTGTTQPVTVREELPAGIVTEDGASVVELQLEPLDANGTVEREVVLRIDPEAASGGELPATFEGQALATSESLEVRAASDPVRILQPRLEVEVSGPQREYLGRDLGFHVRVHNPGEDPASEVVLDLTLPEGVQRVSIDAPGAEGAEGGEAEGVRQLGLGEIPAGETREVRVVFQPAQPGSFPLQATVRGLCVEEQSASAATEVQGVAALRLEVYDLLDPVETGQETTYLVRVQNQGSAEGVDVRLQAELPPELELVSSEGPSEVTAAEGSLQFGPIPNLPPGEVAEWNVVMRALSAGKIRFQLELQSADAPRASIEMEPTTIL